MDERRRVPAVVAATWLVLVSLLVVLAGSSFAVMAAPTPALIEWELIDPDPSGRDGPYEVIAWGNGYVGVGGGSSWASPDGRTWQARALPDAKDGYVGVGGIAAVAGGLVAVGSVSGRAAVWTSDDGLEWQRIPDDPDLGPAPSFGSTELSRVATGPAGLVAVGVEWGDAGQHVMVWRSQDGRDWVRATTPPDGRGAGDVVATADAYTLAVSDDTEAGELMRAAFWSSSDGLEWTAAPDDPSFRDAQPHGLALSNGTLVAVGVRMTPIGFVPAAWVSKDGWAWTPVPDAPSLSWWPFPEPTPVTGEGALQGSAMWAVHPAWSGLLAVGSHWGLDPSSPQPDGTYAMAFRGGIWWSVDGAAWELLSDELVSVSVADASTLQYGLVNVTGLDGQPLVVGTTPEMGLTLWLGPASIE